MKKGAVIFFVFLFEQLLSQAPDWQQKLNVYHEELFPMKVAITFHQPYYAAGDTAFFALYLLTARLVPIVTTQIITVHLISPSGEIIQTLSLLVKNGWATNQFAIPRQIPAGEYRVIAYADWMRNFDRRLWCEETLLVTNGRLLEPSEPNSLLQVMPEGGKLVADVSNRVFVQGRPRGSVAVISKGTSIANLTLDEYGFGSVFLTPTRDQAISFTSMNQVKELITVSDGISLFLVNALESEKSLRVGLQLRAGSEFQNEPVQMIIIHHDQLLYSAAISLDKKNQVLIPVNKESFPTGISVIYLIQHGKVLAERVFFVATDHSRINATLSAAAVDTRSQVFADISLYNDNEALIEGRISVKVFKKGLFSQEVCNPINRQLKIDSDLTNHSFPFKNRIFNKAEFTSFDAFLAMQKWPRFNPEKPLTSNNFIFDFRKEIRISARLINPEDNKPLTSTVVSMYLSRSKMPLETVTNDKGEFDGALVHYFYGEEETFFWAEKNEKRVLPIQIQLNHDTIHFPKLDERKPSSMIDPYFEYSKLRQAVHSSYSEYATPLGQVELSEMEPQNIPEADITVDFDAYLRFPTMSETIKEIIPLLVQRNIKGKNTVRVYISERGQPGLNDPIYLIDGVMTDDSEYFLQLKPTDVDKVEVINKLEKLAKFGRIGLSGVVVVKTKIPENAARVPRNSAHYDWPGLARPKVFHASLTTSDNPRIPQLTPVLLWEPNLSVLGGKATLSIPTSDDIGVYKVVIEGITALGDAIYKELEFEVVDRDFR